MTGIHQRFLNDFKDAIDQMENMDAQPVAIYQVKVGESWIDSNVAEYSLVTNEKRIVYATRAAAPRDALTEIQISEVWNAMPGGHGGWLKQWGYLQFARAILAASAPRV
jgi:hypothetical protein